jgi:hypothetical protein
MNPTVADLYNYSGLENGVFPGLDSPDKIYELAKAMSAGDTTGQGLIGTLTSGAALKTESLDPMLKILTSTDKHIVLHKILPKQNAFNTVEEFNQLVDYGLNIGIFNKEGETPQFTDSIYRRESVLIKYTGVSGEVTHPFTLVRLGSGVGDALAQEVKNKTQFLLRALDKAYPVSDSRLVADEFDGIFKQHYAGVTGAALPSAVNLTTYFKNTSAVIDARGYILSDKMVEDAAHAVVNDNFGMVSSIIGPPIVFSNYVAQFHESKRIIVGSPNGVEGATMGQSVNDIMTQFGKIGVVSDIFFDYKVSKAWNEAASSAKAPAAPVPAGALTNAVTDTDTEFTDSNGNYWYGVTAKNRYGESAMALLDTAVQAIATTEACDITFTHTDGAYAAECFVIYRTEKSPAAYTTAKFYPIITVTRGEFGIGYDGAGAGSVRDKNRIIANTHSAIVLDNSLDVWALKQLAPIMRMDLARTSPSFRFMVLAYLTMVLFAPKKISRIVNIGSAIPSSVPYFNTHV